MKKDVRFVLSLAKFISSAERFPGDDHHLEVREFLKETLKEFGKLETQSFETTLLKPIKGFVERNSVYMEALPYTNSPSKEISGQLEYVGYGLPSELTLKNLQGKIVLVKEGKLPFRKKEKFFAKKGAKGVIVFKENIGEIYSGVSVGLLPVVSISSFNAKFLHSGDFVHLKAETARKAVKGTNLWIDIGEGEYTLHLIAHYDSKPNTFGAIDNGLSVAILVWLLGKLSSTKTKIDWNYKIRFLFTDLEEYGLQGAEHFVSSLRKEKLQKSIAVSVDTVGWKNPAILVSDGEGMNSISLLNFCASLLETINKRDFVAFTDGKSGRSDHIPFRRRGVKTLFFASNPFPYRHTPLDNFEIVDVKSTLFWMKFLTFFVNRLNSQIFTGEEKREKEN